MKHEIFKLDNGKVLVHILVDSDEQIVVTSNKETEISIGDKPVPYE